MVSRSIKNANPSVLSAAGLPDETITVVLRLMDLFTPDWNRATTSMDAGMRRMESGLNRFQHHAYQLESLATRYTHARNEMALAEEQASDRMVRSLRRSEGAIQSYDKIISGTTSLRTARAKLATQGRQNVDDLLSRAAVQEANISRAKEAQPGTQREIDRLEGRIAGSDNLRPGMRYEEALYSMHQLRRARREISDLDSRIADISQFESGTVHQKGILEEEKINVAANRARMTEGIRVMEGGQFRAAATVESYQATFPEAARQIKRMGPDLSRHYFSSNMETREEFPMPKAHQAALREFGADIDPADFKSQLSQADFDARVNREGGTEQNKWRKARAHYTSRSFKPQNAVDEQLQAMFNFDRHYVALTMSEQAPNRVLYPGDRQVGAETGLDYGPIPGGPDRVKQGEGIRFRLDKQPQLYTVEDYRNYKRMALANMPSASLNNESWNTPGNFDMTARQYQGILDDPADFSTFFMPPRQREIAYREGMLLNQGINLKDDSKLISATGPFLDKLPTSNEEAMNTMRNWLGRPSNRPLNDYRGRIYRADPELPDDRRGELNDALFNTAPPYEQDYHRLSRVPDTYTGRGFLRKFTGSLPGSTGRGSAAADALSYIYALESQPHINREVDFLKGEMPMTVASDENLDRRLEVLGGEAATQAQLRDDWTSQKTSATRRATLLQRDLTNQLSLRENPAEFESMMGRFAEWEDPYLRSRGITLPSDLTAPVMVEPSGLARPMSAKELRTEFENIARGGTVAPEPAPAPPISPTPPTDAPTPPVSPTPGIQTPTARATPEAIHLAEANNISLTEVTGTGPGGGILERDVGAEVGRRIGLQHIAPSPGAAPVTPPTPEAVSEFELGDKPGEWESRRPVYPTRNPLITDPDTLWAAVGDLGLSREEMSSRRAAEIKEELGPRDLRRKINQWSQQVYHPQEISGPDPVKPDEWTAPDRELTPEDQEQRYNSAYNRYLESEAEHSSKVFEANRARLTAYDTHTGVSEITTSAYAGADMGGGSESEEIVQAEARSTAAKAEVDRLESIRAEQRKVQTDAVQAARDKQSVTGNTLAKLERQQPEDYIGKAKRTLSVAEADLRGADISLSAAKSASRIRGDPDEANRVHQSNIDDRTLDRELARAKVERAKVEVERSVSRAGLRSPTTVGRDQALERARAQDVVARGSLTDAESRAAFSGTEGDAELDAARTTAAGASREVSDLRYADAPLSRQRWNETRESARLRADSVEGWTAELNEIRSQAGPDNYATYIRKAELDLENTKLALSRVDPAVQATRDLGAPERSASRTRWRSLLQSRMLDLTETPDAGAVTQAAANVSSAQTQVADAKSQRAPFWSQQLAAAQGKKMSLQEHFFQSFNWQEGLDEDQATRKLAEMSELLNQLEFNERQTKEMQGRRNRSTRPDSIAAREADLAFFHQKRVETVNALNDQWDPAKDPVQQAEANLNQQNQNLDVLNQRAARSAQFSPAQRVALDDEWEKVLTATDKAAQAEVRRDRAELDEIVTRRRGDTLANDASYHESMAKVYTDRSELGTATDSEKEELTARAERSRQRAEELRWQQGTTQSFDLNAASANVTSAELGFQSSMRDRDSAQESLDQMRKNFLGGADPLHAQRSQLADFEEDIRFKGQNLSVEEKKILENMLSTQRTRDYFGPEQHDQLKTLLTDLDESPTTKATTQGQSRSLFGVKKTTATPAQAIRAELNRRIKSLGDDKAALASKEAMLETMPEGQDREFTQAEADQLRERVGLYSDDTMTRLHDRRDEYDAIVQEEMQGAPLKRGADETDAEWKQRNLDREAGGYQRQMRDRQVQIDHLETSGDPSGQLPELKKLQDADLEEWKDLGQRSRNLGPVVEADVAQRKSIESGGRYRRNLGATRGALIATYMTQTMQGLFLLTAGLSVVGMAMGMALMPLFDKMTKWWESVQQAAKGQEAVRTQILSTNLALEDQTGVLNRVTTTWDRKTGAALLGKRRSVQVDFNSNDLNMPYIDMVVEGLKAHGLDEETARSTAIDMMAGGSAINDVAPKLREIFTTTEQQEFEALEGVKPHIASQWARHWAADLVTDDKIGPEAQDAIRDAMLAGHETYNKPAKHRGDSGAYKTAGVMGSFDVAQETFENQVRTEIQAAIDAKIGWERTEAVVHAADLTWALDSFQTLARGEDAELGVRFAEIKQMIVDAQDDDLVTEDELEAIKDAWASVDKDARASLDKEEESSSWYRGLWDNINPAANNGTLKPRARGGTVQPNELTLVGEEGPEVVKLPAGSEVYPHNQGPDISDAQRENQNYIEALEASGVDVAGVRHHDGWKEITTSSDWDRHIAEYRGARKPEEITLVGEEGPEVVKLPSGDDTKRIEYLTEEPITTINQAFHTIVTPTIPDPAVLEDYGDWGVTRKSDYDDDAWYEDHVDSLQNNVVKFRTGATGVIVDPTGVIATNNHVIEGKDEPLHVMIPEIGWTTAEVIHRDGETDLALLRILDSSMTYDSIDMATAIKKGERTANVGYPPITKERALRGELDMIISPGRVTNTHWKGILLDRLLGRADKHRIASDALVIPGHSGGAMINDRGELLGITSAAHGKPLKRMPYYIYDRTGGVSVEYLQEVMKDLGILGRAGGGTVQPGETTLVGEEGPEIVQLPSGSQVFPNGQGPERDSEISAAPSPELTDNAWLRLQRITRDRGSELAAAMGRFLGDMIFSWTNAYNNMEAMTTESLSNQFRYATELAEAFKDIEGPDWDRDTPDCIPVCAEPCDDKPSEASGTTDIPDVPNIPEGASGTIDVPTGGGGIGERIAGWWQAIIDAGDRLGRAAAQAIATAADVIWGGITASGSWIAGKAKEVGTSIGEAGGWVKEKAKTAYKTATTIFQQDNR